jgi:hypothetical protein
MPSSPSKYHPEPPPQPRPHVQAAIAAQITAAEANRDKWAKAAKGLKEAGRPCTGEEAMLYIVRQRLALLRQSRTVLAASDQRQL